MPPRLGPSPMDIVPIRMSEEQKSAMQDAADRAQLTLSDYVRKSALWCAEQEVLMQMLREMDAERLRNDPEVRKYLDEQRKTYVARRRHK